MNKLTLLEVIQQSETFTHQNNIDAAIDCYRQWLASEPTESHFRHIAWFNLGSLLGPLDRTDEAITCYEESLKLRPDFYQAAVNLGLSYEKKGDIGKSLSIWQNALQPTEGQTLILNHAGRVYENDKHYEDAEAVLKRSLMINPDQPDALQHYLHLRQKMCKWPVLEPIAGLSEQTLLHNCGPLGILAITDDPSIHRQVLAEWVARKVPRNLPRLSPSSGYQHEKIRLGYLSCDFRWHAVSILTAELFELHDREHFEIYGIDYSIDDGGTMRQRVLSAMDHHLPIQHLSDEDAAKLIRTHEIDILIDLTGLTSGARPAILAYKPAPIQISYLGFVGTSGMSEIDYIIADRFVFPESLKEYFVEKPLYLPDVYQCNDSQRQIGPTPTRESCGLPEDAFVYCSFNGSYKITPEVFSIWMNILKQVPKSVLWLVADNEWAKTNLKKQAEKQGVTTERIIFAEKVPPSEYLARFRIADLMLDTSPYNSGTTASDALWAGLPILTCPGATFASRMAGSLLNAVGLPELVVSDWLQYEQMAAILAENKALLTDYKQRLQHKKLQPLFMTQQFAQNFESILDDLYIVNQQKQYVLKKEHAKLNLSADNLWQTKPKILVNRLEALGDVILVTPVIKKLFLDRNGYCEIYVRTYYTDVFKNNPYVSQTYSCFENGPHAAYDLIINLDNAYENNPKLHIIDAYGFYAFGNIEFEKSLDIFTDSADKIIGLNMQSEFSDGFIVMHMRNTRDHSRNIPASFWHALIDQVKQITSLPILQIGSENDLTISGTEQVYDYRDKFSLQQLKEVIEHAVCFIGADSAPLHIAASTGTDIIGLFTTAKAEYRKPYRSSGRFVAITADIECYGCREIQPLDGNMVCFRDDVECVNRFDPLRVAEILHGLLQAHQD